MSLYKLEIHVNGEELAELESMLCIQVDWTKRKGNTFRILNDPDNNFIVGKVIRKLTYPKYPKKRCAK